MPIFALCAGCAQTRVDAGTVRLPQDCEHLAEPVAPPALSRGMHAKVALARTTSALARANDHLEATRTCQATQRRAYGGAK